MSSNLPDNSLSISPQSRRFSPLMDLIKLKQKTKEETIEKIKMNISLRLKVSHFSEKLLFVDEKAFHIEDCFELIHCIIMMKLFIRDTKAFLFFSNKHSHRKID